MNINDKSVLEMLNKLIAINRLDKTQILQMVNLVSISNDFNDLKAVSYTHLTLPTNTPV